MYSDTLLALERAHLLQLFIWGATSVVLGTALLALVVSRRARSPLLVHFAIQCIAWGAIDLAIAAIGVRGLELRDLGAAVSLDRLLWLNTGLNAGYMAVGLTLALVGWFGGRRMALVGAGTGVIVQGLVLFVLDLRFLAVLSPFV